jgi:hypothetical protein
MGPFLPKNIFYSVLTFQFMTVWWACTQGGGSEAVLHILGGISVRIFPDSRANSTNFHAKYLFMLNAVGKSLLTQKRFDGSEPVIRIIHSVTVCRHPDYIYCFNIC